MSCVSRATIPRRRRNAPKISSIIRCWSNGGAPTHDYRFETITGRSRVAIVRIIPARRTNNSLAIREALLSGAGVAVIPRFVVDRDLAEGRLVPLLAEWRLRDHALFALFTDGGAPPAKLRNFLEILVEQRRVLTDF